jgi:hypothetical protein
MTQHYPFSLPFSDLLICEIACSETVTKSASFSASERSRLESVPAQGISVVRGLVSSKFAVRILERIAEAERRAVTPDEQQDYRIAYVTVLKADEGHPDAWRTAFYQVVCNTPEKAVPFWLARQDAFLDEYFPLSMLPLRYTKEWASDYLRGKMIAERAREAKLPPKKPVQSVRPKLNEEVA